MSPDHRGKVIRRRGKGGRLTLFVLAIVAALALALSQGANAQLPGDGWFTRMSSCSKAAPSLVGKRKSEIEAGCGRWTKMRVETTSDGAVEVLTWAYFGMDYLSVYFRDGWAIRAVKH
jgi:hypothetical protein